MQKTLAMILRLFVLATGLFLSQYSYALDGVPYISVTIEGKTYSVPIPSTKAEPEFYMLKKATQGDEVAREILLGGKDERWFFIGDIGIVRWVYITKTEMHIKEYKNV